jgi:phosphodiesterase/alkaline phosphatase D-like protein
VPGAVGYVLYRVKVAAKEAGEGTDEGADQHYSWPENFKTTIVETTYTDKPNKKFKIDDQKSLNPEGDYWYQVTAVNTAGISPSASIHVGTKQAN